MRTRLDHEKIILEKAYNSGFSNIFEIHWKGAYKSMLENLEKTDKLILYKSKNTNEPDFDNVTIINDIKFCDKYGSFPEKLPNDIQIQYNHVIGYKIDKLKKYSMLVFKAPDDNKIFSFYKIKWTNEQKYEECLKFTRWWQIRLIFIARIKNESYFSEKLLPYELFKLICHKINEPKETIFNTCTPEEYKERKNRINEDIYRY